MNRKNPITIIITIISISYLFMMAALYISSRISVLRNYARLEEQDVQEDVDLAIKQLSESEAKLNTTAWDYAAWDDTYNFIGGVTSNYLKVNFPSTTYQNLQLNLVLIINMDGEIVYGSGYDQEEDKLTPVPDDLLSHITLSDPLLKHPTTDSSLSGILLLPESPLIIASRPIVNSDEQGPILGTLIMGKYLSTDELNRLAKTAQLSLAIHRSDDPQLPPDFAAAKTNLLPGTQSYIQPLNDDIVAGYTLVNDIYGQPALLLRTDSSRDMYKEGKASQNYFMIWIAALGLFSCIIIYIVLDRLVLSRLQERATEVKRKQAEDLYRTLFEQSGDAVFLLDLEGRHVEVNQRATEMLGYSYDELLKLSLKDISAEQSQSKDILSRLLSGEVISTYERIFRKKDGGLIDVEPHITLLRDETGQPFHIQSIVRDISERKRAEAEIRTRTNELSTLYDLSRALANANDLDKVLGLVNRHTVENIRITFACIALLEDGNLATRSVYPIRVLDHDLLINSTRPITAMPFCQSVLEQDQPVILRSSEQSISGEERDHLPLDFAQTLCLIPLRIHDFASNSSRMLGLLMVGESRKEEREPFTPAKIRLVRSIGDQAAIAINNVRLFNDLQRSNVDLSQAYTATISGWAAALELRDKETEGHAQRVTEMTFRLAKQMGFSEQELVQIRYGALLHDIGKMGVPDRILLKPDTLTDEERGIMCMHPTYAYQMLKPITYLGCALNIPYCHHEKWDGTGYPRGLIGEQIPIEAQLFAVVDVYDALTSDRPYRKSWPHEKTLEHIQGLSGSHFCPQVVDEFIKLLNKVE